MSATAIPTGLHPVGNVTGGAYNGKQVQYPITTTYATSIFYGDVVKIHTDGCVNKATTTTGATNASFGCGVFLGCNYTDPGSQKKVWKQYWPASTAATDAVAFVETSIDALFQIQANGSLAQTAMGTIVDLVQTAGSTVYGTSKVAVSAASSTNSTTGPFRVVGFVAGPDSAVGDAYTDLLVMWNATYHQFNSYAAGI